MEVAAMDLIVGCLHTAFPMGDVTRVGEARRHAALLAESAALDDTAAGRLALVVTELGNNLVRHAKGGQLLIAARPGSGEVEVISMDDGPGIPDIARSMGDGYSTGGTPGTGLGAVRRLAQDFDMHSAMGEGTVAVARIRNSGAVRAAAGKQRVECAGISTAAPGETVCGDAWAVGLDGSGGSVMVADGLGHGPDAAEASLAALEVFGIDPACGLAEMMERTHAHLRSTRGAAVSVMRLDAANDTIVSCGAGNVMGRIVSGVSDKSLLAQHGTAGVQVRKPEETVTAWPAHALLVVHSDGIESRWSTSRLMPVLGRDPSLAAAILMRDHCRGRDDATVVVLRRKE
ncbi:ATP-binding protein [Caenimonas aquaedulcis]|uniref:ATP-binding protein n=1 Tax=Caenimonas aquaedulcis TaxID=2793270 RepID=A0A931MEZ7_9BURK|nr:ATP-binding protein [Caenimonas aquaedulcis]MBG9387062.1 ATP-binding protein [Caenimonas aquaedulcis]